MLLGIELRQKKISTKRELSEALPLSPIAIDNERIGISSDSVDHAKIPIVANSAWEFISAIEALEGNSLALTLAAKFIGIHRRGDLKSLSELQPVRDFNERFVKWHDHQSVYRVMAMIESNLVREIVLNENEATLASQQLMVLFFLGFWDRPADLTLWNVVFAKPSELPPISNLEESSEHVEKAQCYRHDSKFGAVSHDLARALFHQGHQIEQFELEEISIALERQHLVQRRGESTVQIDCHPLVREYFGIRLNELDAEGKKLAHGRLFEYFKCHGLPGEFKNRTAYAAHGCLVVFPFSEDLPWDVKKRYIKLQIQDFATKLRSGMLKLGHLPGDIAMLFQGFDANEMEQCAEWLDHHSFDETVESFRPENEELLYPLYQGVSHGCQAEREMEAYCLLYGPRIRQGELNFAAANLGLYGLDLAALASFFEEPFSLPSERLSEKIKALILGNSAFRLGALGRLGESLEPSKEAASRMLKLNDYGNAGINLRNMSERLLALGKLAKQEGIGAAQCALESIIQIDRSNSERQKASLRANFARVQLMLGKLGDKRSLAAIEFGDPINLDMGAEILFREAESIWVEATKGVGLELTGISGASYCECLLARGRFDEAQARAEFALRFGVTKQRYSLLDIAFDKFIIARSSFLLQVESSVVLATLDKAMDAMRAANEESYLPIVLILAAEIHWHQGKLDLALKFLREVEAISSYGPMPLYQLDAKLLRCRMLVADFKPKQLTEDPQDIFEMRRATELLIKRHHYHRRFPDLALLDLEIASAINANPGCLDTQKSNSWAGLSEATDRALNLIRAEGWYGMIHRLTKLLPANQPGLAELRDEEKSYNQERDSYLRDCRERAEKLSKRFLSTFELVPDSALADDIENFGLPKSRDSWQHEQKADYGKSICDRIDLEFGSLPATYLDAIYHQLMVQGQRLPRHTIEWPDSIKAWCIKRFQSNRNQ